MGFPMGRRRRTGRRGLAIRFRQLCAFGSYAGRHRLLDDADNVSDAGLAGKQWAEGPGRAGRLSSASAAVVLFLIWSGQNPSNPTVTEPLTSILIGIQDRKALVNEPIPLGAVLFGVGEEA